ncbi:MAG: FAD-binding oxidoreductase, partial [Thermoplasmata archaeon]|nr:FAD-binding oxidoreductase [Thermoplasmata archaeon]
MGDGGTTLEGLKVHLEKNGIVYDEKGLEGFASDSSFLTLGTPGLVVYLKTEDDALRLVEYAIRHDLKLVPRGTGSGTAGSSLAREGEVLVNLEMMGVCDKWGCRLPVIKAPVVNSKGEEVDIEKASPDDELYVRVGAGATSDELNKWLNKQSWTIAVVPSSGYSTFGGNLGTNARGSGTPIFGPFGEIVSRVRMVLANDEGPKAIEITDRNEIK